MSRKKISGLLFFRRSALMSSLVGFLDSRPFVHAANVFLSDDDPCYPSLAPPSGAVRRMPFKHLVLSSQCMIDFEVSGPSFPALTGQIGSSDHLGIFPHLPFDRPLPLPPFQKVNDRGWLQFAVSGCLLIFHDTTSKCDYKPI